MSLPLSEVYNVEVMISFEPTQTAPLTKGEDGTIRISGSRVTLDSLVGEFKRGATAEQIQEDFPSLGLREVYGAIAYYLEHMEAVEEYLQQQKKAGEETRIWIESKQETNHLRQRLQVRRSNLVK
jgi:uncharacterized protein (DUF433 family)